MHRIHNFSAGPAILPVPVLEAASRAVLEFCGAGMSLLEMSHRDKRYDAVHQEALAGVLEALGLSSDEYAVAFLGGGASLQFAMLPMNFLGAGETADYIDAGEWGSKAIAEAKRVGSVHVAGSSAGTKYDRLPENYDFSPGARYVHLTTNNTIEGTQVHTLPDVGETPLVADVSSDIFGVERDYSRLAMLYGGAQKNAGPAGVTMVIIRRDFLATAKTDLSPMLSYRSFVEKESLYNTPPVFGIFVVNEVLKWIKAEGGVGAIARRNEKKAGLIYDAIDANPGVYCPCVANRKDRSWMNITFRLASDDLQKEFLAEAKAAGMDGLPGHRNVGGLRASIYNASPIESSEALASLLTDFARRKG